ncbi:MAG: dihydroorotate dehydrogenase electron transfer subunit [Nitrospira sp.]|nr:dihydroorotate dehydrogenase electron transfer subunit [Nitrospira sp.]
MKARVFSNSCLQGTYYKLIFLPPARVHTLPGQFVMIRVCTTDSLTDPFLSRPFSIHRQAMDGSIEIIYKVVGKGTDLLTKLRKGDYIEFLGPLGNGFPISPPDEAIIIAGGIGVAPMLSLIETIKSSEPETTIKVFLGGRGKEDLLFVEELENLANELILTTNDGSAGVKGYVTDELHEYLSNGHVPRSRSTIYSCGPTPMLRKILELTEPLGIETFVSLESAMACGIGLCMGCVVKKKDVGYFLVCKDGPVFKGNEIEIVMSNE